MLKDQLVLEYIKTSHSATIQDLCNHFSVSESTVRRVLKRLETDGKLTRFRGGAYSFPGRQGDTPIMRRSQENEEKKSAIGKAAADLVTDNSTIIMLGGSTVYSMCRFLQGKRITIITNSLLVLNELWAEEFIHIILLGGTVNPEEEEVYGPLTSSSIHFVRADYVFMSTTSFNEKQGFITKDLDSIELYQSCMQTSMNTVFLADSTKYGANGLSVTATPREATILITDSELPKSVVGQFREQGVRVITTC